MQPYFHIKTVMKTAAVAAWLISSNAAATVDMMPWALTGKLDVTAAIAGKSVTAKRQTLGTLTAIFAANGSFSAIGADGLQLVGTWTQSKSKFKVQLNPESVAALLASIEQDLLVQSNLGAQLAVKSASCNGTEKNGRLQGALTIGAKLTYPGYSNKTGALTLIYRFSGA